MDNLGQFYASVGGNAAEMLSRLGGNEALVKMLLGKFPKDDSFSSLCAALDGGRTEEAFRAAHTLKGVSANLGLQNLFVKASEVTEFLRGGDSESARKAMPGLTAEYEHVCTLLGKTD